MVSQPGLVVGVLVSAAALASAGFLLVSATALGDSEPLFYLLASSGAVWKVAGLAVALTLVVIIATGVSSHGLFLGALVSSLGLAIVTALLVLSSISDSMRLPGAAAVTLGVFVVSSWWASDSRRSCRYLHASVILAAILASFFLVVAAQSLRYIVQDPFPSCRTGISQALLHGGSSLLCVSLLALLETCCWARRRAG